MYQLILNLIPQGMLPRLNVSQYDHGQTVDVTLYEGATAYTLPSNATVTVSGTKADNTGFEYNCTTTGGLSFTIADQMTVFAGEVECELTIRYGNNRISTINFILDVERAALQDNVVISETDIPILQQIPEYAAQASANANLAHKWATGGGSDTPSATNNAKYWAQQAAQTDIGRAIAVDYSTDKTPYQFRRCTHNAVYDKLVGISYVKNQLVQNGNFANGTTGWLNRGGASTTISVVNGWGCVDGSNATTDSYPGIGQAINQYKDHVYLLTFDAKGASGSETLRLNNNVGINGAVLTLTTSAQRKNICYKANKDSSNGVTLYTVGSEHAKFFCKNVNVIDLTVMFSNPAIADKIYTMEQAEAGSGLAWIRQYGFLNDAYIEYNAGAIESSAPTVRKVVGKNLLNRKTFGLVDVTGAGAIRQGFTPIKLLAGTYTFSRVGGTPGASWYVTNVSNGYTNTAINSNPFTFTLDSDSDVMIRTGSASGTAVNDTNIQLEFGSEATAYEPYKEVTYPLGGDTLRGVPKLVGGDLVADGDIKTSDGVVNSRYTKVDLGTLNFAYNNGIFYVALSPAPVFFQSRAIGNAICSKYVAAEGNTTVADKCFTIFSYYLRIADSAYTDAATFKTAMSGQYLVYEKATPTSTVSTPFTSPQVSLETEETDTICGHDSVVVDIPEWMQNEYFDDVRADASKVQGIERNLGEIECDKTTAGTYTLSCTVDSSGNKTYSWA
jgi:hypothetical protein